MKALLWGPLWLFWKAAAWSATACWRLSERVWGAYWRVKFGQKWGES